MLLQYIKQTVVEKDAMKECYLKEGKLTELFYFTRPIIK